MPTMRKIKQKEETETMQEKETYFALDITDIESGEFNVGPCSSMEELHKDMENILVEDEIEEPLMFAILKQIAVVNVSMEKTIKIENV